MKTAMSIGLILILAGIVSGCGRGPDANAIADPVEYLAPVIVELEKKSPKNRTVNIVCHGHSVPAGYIMTPKVDTFNAYPHLLHEALKERFPNAVINVIVTAIGAEASPAGEKRFLETVLNHRPDVLLIDYGLNDRDFGLEAADAAWSKMIKKAKARGILVLLLTPTDDLGAAMHDPDDPLNQHAEQIRDLARQHGVGLVDSWARYVEHAAGGGKREDLLAEPNHPNRNGHELVAREIMKWFGAPAG